MKEIKKVLSYAHPRAVRDIKKAAIQMFGWSVVTCISIIQLMNSSVKLESAYVKGIACIAAKMGDCQENFGKGLDKFYEDLNQ